MCTAPLKAVPWFLCAHARPHLLGTREKISVMNWETTAEAKFKLLMAKIPAVLRGIAEQKVSKKAESLAAAQGHSEVTEKDMVDAFFAETPFGFHGPMKCDMEEVGVDYTQYGYKR